MVILEDTRQQAQKHELKHEYFAAEGLCVVRSKLAYGDYAPPPPVAVDTKANVEEIAQNIGGKEHARFREECKLAQKCGSKLIILIENEHGYRCIDDVEAWVNPNFRKTSKSIEGPRLAKAMRTMSARYGVEFVFCSPDEAGKKVIELLEANNGK